MSAAVVRIGFGFVGFVIGLAVWIAVDGLNWPIVAWTYVWAVIAALLLIKAVFDWPSRYGWPLR